MICSSHTHTPRTLTLSFAAALVLRARAGNSDNGLRTPDAARVAHDADGPGRQGAATG